MKKSARRDDAWDAARREPELGAKRTRTLCEENEHAA